MKNNYLKFPEPCCLICQHYHYGTVKDCRGCKYKDYGTEEPHKEEKK